MARTRRARVRPTRNLRATEGTMTLAVSPAQDTNPQAWNSFRGQERAVARDVVPTLALLLHDVVRWTGGAGTRALLANLRATLATDGPESALPLGLVAGPLASRQEMRRQASVISHQLLGWVEDDLAHIAGRRDNAGQPPSPAAAATATRGHPRCSICSWARAAAPSRCRATTRSCTQMVLLRDALLPFTNWEQVPVRVGETGLRHLDEAREAFAVELIMRQARATAVLDFARQVVEGTAGPEGYGFTSRHGTVLPAVASSDLLTASSRLLTWHAPAAVDVSQTSDCDLRTAAYDLDDYFAAPRTPVSALQALPQPRSLTGAQPGQVPSVEVAMTSAGGAGTCSFSLRVATRGQDSTVDLGQAVRGHRYAHRVPDGAHDAEDENVTLLDAGSVLAAPSLVWAETGTWAVDAARHPALALALLGKLYPENVMVAARRSWGALDGVGKEGTATFVIINAAQD